MEAIQQSIITWLTGVFGENARELVALFVSMIPILELRAGLPLAVGLGLKLWVALPICIIGNLIPVPFILWLITPIFNALKRTKLFRPMVEKLEKRAMSKSDKIEKGYFWGLVLFVGIPLPGTGAWTGSLIAALLGIPPKKALPAVALGVLLAAAIMTVLSVAFGAALFGIQI